MKKSHLPFYPVRVPAGWIEPLEGDAPLEEVAVMFDCRWLGPDGRCLHYEKRPQLCRDYEPLTDLLCAERLPDLKGIPIRSVLA